MARGCEVAAWFLGEAQRVFGMIDVPEDEKGAVALLKYFASQLEKGVTQIKGPDLLRKGPRPRKKNRYEPALAVLQTHGWISQGPGNMVVLNPAIQGAVDELP